jgi:DnaJ-class molecular chaperone
MSYYDFLGVPNNATLKEIKSIYKMLALKYHPDRGGNHNKFIKLQKIYETLSDPIERSKYDDSIKLNSSFFSPLIKKEVRSPISKERK